MMILLLQSSGSECSDLETVNLNPVITSVEQIDEKTVRIKWDLDGVGDHNSLDKYKVYYREKDQLFFNEWPGNSFAK